MQANHVELPSEDLIEPSVLVNAIVKALHPEKTEGLRGLECIGAKVEKFHSPSLPKNLGPIFGTSNDLIDCRLGTPFVHDTERTDDQLEPPSSTEEFTQDLLDKVVEDENGRTFVLPLPLTDEDRQLLEPLLNHLPPLSYPMTEHAISKFLDAYLALQQRPSWIPRVITQDAIQRRQERHNAAKQAHMKAIRQEIEDGKLQSLQRLDHLGPLF